MNKKLLFSIFLVVLIDLLGFGLILPLLPFYAESFGANAVLVGFLVADYAFFQLIGAPILGRLSDRLGRRPVLLISIAGNLIGFILLGFATNLPMLFIARALSGLTGGNISVAQAYISDVTDSSNRAKGLGLIGAAFGLGFIIGPALGGILSQWGYNIPAFVAAGVVLVNLLLVIFWLPESLTPEKRLSLSINKRPPFTIKALVQALRRPYVGALLHTRFFYGLAFSMFQSIFALYGQYRFQLESQNTGYILAYVGVLSVIVQGVAIGRLAKKFSENQLILAGTLILSISFVGWAFAPSITILLIVLAPIALAAGILNTMINSALSKSVDPVEVGGTLGLAAALESFTRVIAPSLGGWMLLKLGTASPGIFSAFLMAALITYVWRYVYRNKKSIPIMATPNQSNLDL